MNQTEERTWAVVCHLSALLGYLIPFGGNVLGPFIAWQLKKNESEFVADQGREAFLFQLSIVVYMICGAILFLIVLEGGSEVFLLYLVALGIVDLVFVVIATIKANQGIRYRYPISIRLFMK